MDFSKFLETIAKEIASLLGDAAKSLFGSRRTAFVTTVVCLISALVLAGWSLKRADYYQRLVESALSKPTEATPQTFKALESLVLSDVEADEHGNEIDFKGQIEKAAMSESLQGILKEIDSELRSTAPIDPRPLTITAPPDLATADLKQANAIVTELNDAASDVGFLFLPARMIQMKPTDFTEASARNKTLESIIG